MAEGFDANKRAAFEARLLDVQNGGAIALMVSIGHRTGLFDVMSELPPASSAKISWEAGLVERYVREWLGAMVTAHFVEYDAAADTYFLPREHASLLTRAARPDNRAAAMQWIPLLASVESEIVRCFEQGGGVPYGSFERLDAVMAELSDQSVVAVLLEQILPAVPGLVNRLQGGCSVLDVGCGSGLALNRMAERFPRSLFTGYDVSAEAISAAKLDASERGLANVHFEVRDVSRLDERAVFDVVTAFDAIHDQAKPADVLAAIARSLRPGGCFLMQEAGGTSRLERDLEHPLGPFLYTASCMHCVSVSLAQGGVGLGAMWGRETAVQMLHVAGFAKVDVEKLPHDPTNLYYVAHIPR
jgi:SAM-dependent methyltransferase